MLHASPAEILNPLSASSSSKSSIVNAILQVGLITVRRIRSYRWFCSTIPTIVHVSYGSFRLNGRTLGDVRQKVEKYLAKGIFHFTVRAVALRLHDERDQTFAKSRPNVQRIEQGAFLVYFSEHCRSSVATFLENFLYHCL